MENGAGKHGVHYDNAAPDFGSTDVIRTFVRRWKWLQIGSPGAPVVAMNWVVSLAGASILAAFVMASLLSDGCVDEDKTCDANTEFKAWQTWVTQNFSWLYIGTQNVWIAFILFIALSKYGTLKLGKKDDSKEFSDLSWFAMLFACGIGSGIWYWGVSEPTCTVTCTVREWPILHISATTTRPQATTATFGWVFFLCFILMLSTLRSAIRKESKIDGSYIQDFFTTLMLYPMVAAQIMMHAETLEKAAEKQAA